VLWESTGWAGRKRTLVEDAPHLGWLEFDNATQAVGVHPGPDYQTWKNAHANQEPELWLHENPHYGGKFLNLTAGIVQDIRYSFQMTGVTSIRIAPFFAQGAPGNDEFSLYSLPAGNIPPGGPGAPVIGQGAPTIAPIPLVVELYQDGDFNGNFIVVVEDAYDVGVMFGASFNNAVSSIRIKHGSGWNGEQATFFKGANFGGQSLALPPGSYNNLTKYGFNNAITSLKVK
jgi:hypothetical protein